jgi:eukaryotic-like serine/threonine-protein kinase
LHLKCCPSQSNTDPLFLQRFEAEARAAANFHHTNIVPVFEFGRSQTHHYFTMQLIEGDALNTFVSVAGVPENRTVLGVQEAPFLAQRLSEKDRYRAVARIGVQVASAIAYAHQRGVIHRDIKPSNLILDNEATVWVTDFGLAKTPDLNLTQTGTLLGTIRYMAPERLRGTSCDIPGDLYSLGATLYELLAGKPAFSGDDYLKTIEAIARGNAPTLRTFDPDIPLDLQTIIEKAMHREASARYTNCEELGADLERFLNGQPIKARQVRLREKICLWSKAHPALAASLAAIAALLLVGAIGSSCAAAYFYRQQQYQAGLVKEVETKRAENQQNLYLAEMNLAAPVANSDSGVVRLRELLSHWIPKDGEKDLRGWEWYFFSACSLAELSTIEHNTQLSSVAWHPSKRLILAGGPGSVFLWDAVTRDQLWYEVFDDQYQAVNSVAWSSDGEHFAAVSLSGQVWVWELQTRTVVSRVHEGSPVGSVCWHPSGKVLIYRTLEPDARMMAWDLETGERSCIAESIGGDMNYAFGFDPQGKQLAGVSTNQAQYQVSVWNVEIRQELFAPSPRQADTVLPELIWPVSSMSWRPDGKQLAQASFDGSIRFWDPSGKRLIGQVKKPNDLPILALAWNPHDPVVAAAGEDGVVRLIPEKSISSDDHGRPFTRPIQLKGHSASIRALSWCGDGSKLATVSGDKSIRIWQLREPAILRGKLPTPDTDARLEWGIYPEQLNVMLAGHRAIWNVCKGEVLNHQYGIRILESFDGRYRVILGQDHRYVEEYENGPVLQLPLPFAFSSDGSTTPTEWCPHRNDFAFAVRIHDASVGLQVASFTSGLETPQVESVLECEQVYAVRWHPAHRWLALSYYPNASDGTSRVVIVDVDTHEFLYELHDSFNPVHALTWSPDGKQLAYASQDGAIRIYDLTRQQTVRVFTGHTRDIRSIDWHPKGNRLASGSEDGTVKVWDVATGQFAASLEHNAEVRAVAWDRNGWRLASMSSDGELVVWNAASQYAAQ